ncbi:MAG: hypothetical protein JNM93_12170 [Bacteriovoracaceae bacterium]|nr:hypothetical protein [Bacteriovoracaceae bacterium]
MKTLMSLVLLITISACNSEKAADATATSATTTDCANKAAGHDGHTHGTDCGHEATQHEGHTDYNHDGSAHTQHEGHTDSH